MEPILVAAFVAVLAAVLVAAVIPVIWFVVVVLANDGDDS